MCDKCKDGAQGFNGTDILSVMGMKNTIGITDESPFIIPAVGSIVNVKLNGHLPNPVIDAMVELGKLNFTAEVIAQHTSEPLLVVRVVDEQIRKAVSQWEQYKYTQVVEARYVEKVPSSETGK